jgi:hypothetical protein
MVGNDLSGGLFPDIPVIVRVVPFHLMGSGRRAPQKIFWK